MVGFIIVPQNGRSGRHVTQRGLGGWLGKLPKEAGLAVPAACAHAEAMRTVFDEASVRLYHLAEDGGTTTLFYGPLGEAMALAAQQPEDVQAGLFLQTSNDVASYLDLVEG